MVAKSKSLSSAKEERVFFPGINALRFFAALGVIISHIELLKEAYGFNSYYWNNPFVFNLGSLGVYFFFVLSGFLITFLLLKEKENFGEIKIKAFYFRRILRIWPLYYLICILGFFILPAFAVLRIDYLNENFLQNYWPNLLLYTCMLPNVAFSLFSAVPHIGQLWSIGVEEQFYIAWPWIISKSRYVIKTLVYIISGIILVKVLVLGVGRFYGDQSWYQSLKLFVAMSKFECMAIGGVGAYYLYEKNEKVLRIVCNRWVFSLSLLMIPVLIYCVPAGLQDGVHIPFAFIFLIQILTITSKKQIWRFLENKIFSYLGKISYGLYVYHLMIIPVIIYLYKHFQFKMAAGWFNLVIYSLVILGSIAVSGISYALFEKKFIRLKSKYTYIDSGEAAKQ